VESERVDEKIWIRGSLWKVGSKELKEENGIKRSSKKKEEGVKKKFWVSEPWSK